MTTQIVNFPESNSSAELSQIISVPNIQTATVLSKTPTDATVRTVIGTNQVTVYAGGGTPTRSVTNPTKLQKVGTGSQQSSSNSFPATITYSDAQGYAGNIPKSGTATVISGSFTAADSKQATATRTGSTSTFPSTVFVSSGGYSGDIPQSGSAFVTSGTLVTFDQKSIEISQSCSITWYWVWTGSSWSSNTNPAWTHSTSSTYNYSSGGYTGTLSRNTVTPGTRPSAPSSPGTSVGQTTSISASTGTVWYSGLVTRQASDTRQWQQNYAGTITKPAVDTRIWQQNYSGTVYKAGTDDYWTYSVTLDVAAANTAPTATVTSPKNSLGTLYSATPSILFLPSDTDSGATITDFRVQYATDTIFAQLVIDQTRSINANGFSAAPVSSGTTCKYTPSTAIPYGTYYARVSVFDGTTWGVFSNYVKFTTADPLWTDPNLRDDAFGFRSVWVDELRSHINATRLARGLTVFFFSDATLTANSTKPRKTHIDELRAAMSGFGTFTYTDPIITANVTPRKGIHIKEIRSFLENV